MLFKVKQVNYEVMKSPHFQAYLIEDKWDDWFEFSTLYSLVFVDRDGEIHYLGGVKIGQFNMSKGQRRPLLPEEFDGLDQNFFSLGQDASYYEELNDLGDEIRDRLLTALNDISIDDELLQRAIGERVTKISLLRYVSTTTVSGQFRRLALGGVKLSRYQFTYKAPKSRGSNARPIELSFNVEPESNPPTNIHVLIGRNGVGKTFLINNMIKSLLDIEALPSKVGLFTSELIKGNKQIFANLVSVTFSAFDESEPLPERKDKTLGIQYSYIGLKRIKNSNDKSLSPKSPEMLKNEFVKSVKSCRSGAKGLRWRKALEMLEADPIFKEAEVTSIAKYEDETEFMTRASKLFKSLSSGHKIVLLTITRLVETVEERTLVLLDEPEAHLHPPLLSAFTRALSDLLINRNGVAIIATHSPVILQEVPKSCVWKLRRTGLEVSAERLEIESFGENIGALTREVFGLEVTHSGFHKLLIEAVEINNDFDAVEDFFNEEIGMEARAIIRALLSLKYLKEGQ
ncbi:AAA family ATPase [Desulfosporosinus sp. FKB]|uniref:AAA family ATPase n=1 Tax=Desulfosporosinus sp. FKB TaxID=1969835 RepID=UPI000B49B565|nr:AAA family ATPase [Desulfosporosinus sp. FKB]